MILLAGIGDLKDQHNERQLISRMLTNHTVDFLWNSGSDWPGWPAQDNKITVFNRYSRAGFTSKVSLVRSIMRHLKFSRIPFRNFIRFQKIVPLKIDPLGINRERFACRENGEGGAG